jgi:type IV pilus assembly protein PilE
MIHMIRKQRGVTLMELMTVMVIVGILSAIAYPSYRAQVLRSNRTEARVALEQTAGALEKCYTRYMQYDDTANCPTANQFNGGATLNTPQGYYQISAPTLNGTQFTVRADARGAQASDTTCPRLELDQTGNRTPATCW